MSIGIGKDVFVVTNKPSKVLGDFLPALDDHTEGKLYHDIEDSFSILAFDCAAGIVSFEVVCLIQQFKRIRAKI